MSRLPRPSVRAQQRLTRGMQAALCLIVVYGLLDGRPKAVTNGVLGVGVTLLPAGLRHRYDVPLDPWLGLWVTGAVFLHTLGSAGLYTTVTWWDSVTHALSATVVAGAGYTAARAVDLHDDHIHVPRRYYAVYLLVVVLALGVVWELFEFGLDRVADATGLTMPLAQTGLDDTVVDLLYNSLGAVLVAVFGQAHLTGVAEAVREQLLGED